MLSTKRLTKIHSITQERIIAGSGCLLATAKQKAASHRLTLPISIAAKCSLGGLVATNAGGANVTGYGTAGELVLGLEVVTADGKIVSSINRPFKNNYGYRWHNWFVGTEGTLGFITKVDIRLYPMAKQQTTVLLPAPNPVELANRLTHCFATGITALEYISKNAMELGLAYNKYSFCPPQDYILLEVKSDLTTPNLTHYVTKALAKLGIKKPISHPNLWQLRGSLSDAAKARGLALKHDISVPKTQLAHFLTTAPKRLRLAAGWQVICFGHLGDGSLHYNLQPPPNTPKPQLLKARQLYGKRLWDLVASLKGSITAEHGTGRFYNLKTYTPKEEYQLMATLKQALDPHHILGRGVIWQNRA